VPKLNSLRTTASGKKQLNLGVSLKMRAFLFFCSFYKLCPTFIKFSSQYTEIICNPLQQLLICPFHLHNAATLPWEYFNYVMITPSTKVIVGLPLQKPKISSFSHDHCPTVQPSLSITEGIHNSLLFQPHMPEVSDFKIVLMDQSSQNVLIPMQDLIFLR